MEVIWTRAQTTDSISTSVFLLIFTSILHSSKQAHLPLHKSVQVGSDVILTCPAPSDDLVPVVWSTIPNTTLMSDRTTIRRRENASELHVRNVSWMDAGVYRCQQRDSLITTTRLVVICKNSSRKSHIVLPTLTEKVVRQGDNLQLDCSTAANITWRRQTSRGGEEHIYTARHLNICNVQISDAGVYTCTADDEQLQQLVRKMRLIVEYAPAVNSPFPYVRQALNYSSHLECVIDAFPTARVLWFKEDMPINNNNSRYQLTTQTREHTSSTFSATLIVLRTNHSDYGNYTCRAVNALGITAFTLQLGHSPLPILPMTRGTNITPETGRITTRNATFSGFILGMLPPLCISVYIILHLSFFRSRYAEERPEEEGGDGLDEIVWEQGFKT